MNKKLIKIISGITCGLAVAVAIPTAATSCSEATTLTSIKGINNLTKFNFNSYKNKLGFEKNKNYDWNPRTGEPYDSAINPYYLNTLYSDAIQNTSYLDNLIKLLAIGTVEKSIYESYNDSDAKVGGYSFETFLQSNCITNFEYKYTGGQVVRAEFKHDDESKFECFTFNQNISFSFSYMYANNTGKMKQVDELYTLNVADTITPNKSDWKFMRFTNVSSASQYKDLQQSNPYLGIELDAINPSTGEQFDGWVIHRSFDGSTWIETTEDAFSSLTPFFGKSDSLVDWKLFFIEQQ